jgi:hypothetical protein
MLCCACACSCMRRFCLEMERKRVEPRSTRLGIRGSNATARLDPRKLDPDTRPLSTSATINSNPPSVIFAHQGTSPTLINPFGHSFQAHRRPFPTTRHSSAEACNLKRREHAKRRHLLIRWVLRKTPADVPKPLKGS